MLDEIKIQPLFAKPLAFTKISVHESDIQIIKDLEYKQIEPDGFQSVDDMIWDRLPDLTRDIEYQVKAFNDTMDSGTLDQAQLAISGIQAKYNQANNEPNLLAGEKANAGSK